MPLTPAHAPKAAHELHAQLRDWLVHAAYPLWAQAGYDHARGGGTTEPLPGAPEKRKGTEPAWTPSL